MSIIDDAVRVSHGRRENKTFHFKELSLDEQILLDSINRNQRSRWFKRGIVPPQVLRLFHGWGVMLLPKTPTCGMKLDRFLEELWLFRSRSSDPALRSLADYIYMEMVRTMHPDWRKHLRPRRCSVRITPKPSRNGPCKSVDKARAGHINPNEEVPMV